MINESTTFPTAAQLAKNKAEVDAAIRQAMTAMNLRIRALELAANFTALDPVKLARDIYDFIKEGAET